MPQNLIESELFGHERGSFTGADASSTAGSSSGPHGGTLFLDEITEMPSELQVKLLRVLETGKVMRVGGEQPITVDVRLVAATNRIAADRGAARASCARTCTTASTSSRSPCRRCASAAGDVELLAEHFLDSLNQREGTSKKLAHGGARPPASLLVAGQRARAQER